MESRQVWFFSTARSDYDLMAPVILALRDRRRVAVGVVASGAQLSPFHGMGVRQIEEDGVDVVGRVESILASETWAARSLSFAGLTAGLTRLFEQKKPDLLFVAGDREEHLAAALVANFFRIPVAHLHGGDRCVASDIDEVMRPAISKLSHLHFPATEGHRERLIRLGEDPERIWACGAPGLDRLRTTPDIGVDELSGKLGFNVENPFVLLIQHPSPMLREAGGEELQMTEILEGLLPLGLQLLCSYPNADPGNVGIRTVLDRYRRTHSSIHLYHNLPREQFVGAYRRCALVAGNSSSLVIESGYLQKPALLIGPRQNLRECGQNVIRVGFERLEIERAGRRALEDPGVRAGVSESASPYGDGYAAPRIAEILESVELQPEWLLKTIPY